MKSATGKESTRVLERHGWTLLRVQGSHHIYGKVRKPGAALGADSW
jgi:predicted RNA binding protein YcfA (HicA-like mRNA interferase family)